MMLFGCFILLVLSFIWPFVNGQYEMIRRKDPLPLYINMDYIKDPRYFARSFRRLISNAIIIKEDLPEGLSTINLSKQELLMIVDDAKFGLGTLLPNLYLVKKNLLTDYKVGFEKEVYVLGQAKIGENNKIRALACDQDIHVGAGTKIVRWLDAQGSIKVEDNCDLGVITSTDKELLIKNNCTFKRLFGLPIRTGKIDLFTPLPLYIQPIVFDRSQIERDITEVPTNCKKDCSIITTKSLIIQDNAIIRGHIKTHANLVIGKNVIVMGNVFAENDIVVGESSRILGVVFSQNTITLEPGVCIGVRGHVKSVIGNKGVIIAKNVTVFGYISTEGEGVVA